LAKYGIDADFVPCEDMSLNPARSAEIIFNKARLGVVGEIHPRVLANFDIAEKAFLFELDVDKLFTIASKPLVYKAASKYPSVTRDIALLVDAEVTYDKMLAVLKKFSIVSEVKLFDLYEGKQVPAGKKSMAFRLTYQVADRTLKDEEVDGVQKQILGMFSKEFGAQLRS
jgi:phenylalanyl-tRNA synthetase beta chain